MGHYAFKKKFVWLEELGPKSGHFLIRQPTVIIQKQFIMSLWFVIILKLYIETSNNGKHHHIATKN